MNKSSNISHTDVTDSQFPEQVEDATATNRVAVFAHMGGPHERASASVATGRPTMTEPESSVGSCPFSDAISPATVRLVTGNRLLVDDGYTTAWALNALAYPFDAKLGDELLVARNPKQWYVIGVLSQRDTLLISTRGDIEFAAKGQIRFTARDSFRVDTSCIHFTSTHFQVAAKSAVQHFDTLRSNVRGVLSVKAGELRKIVKGRYRLRADRIDERASHDVNIDGKKINLG